jgi:hypothetical protein
MDSRIKFGGLGKNKFTQVMVLAFIAVASMACTRTISGKLTTESGGLVVSEDARVNISRLDQSGRSEMYVYTIDSDGEFESTDDLKPGRYLVEVLAPGYSAVSAHVDMKKSSFVKLVTKKIEKTRYQSFGANEDVELGRGSGGAVLTPPQL